MKKILLILLIVNNIIFCPVIYANTAALAATTITNSAIRRNLKKQEHHRNEYHKGPTSSYSEYIEIWDKDEFKKNVIYKYEKIYYYYSSIDTERCIQDIQTKGPISIRYPTEQEIRDRKNGIIFLFCIVFFSILIIFILTLFKKNNNYKINQ